MDIVLCDTHGAPCLLKTGVKDGPNKGKSFYLCSDRCDNPCAFTKSVDIPPSHCLHHKDSVVELQALVYSVKDSLYRLFYRCVLGKKEGKKWCGNVPWMKQKEAKTSPTLNVPFPSEERNPFKKKSEMTSEASEWRETTQRKEVPDKQGGAIQDGDGTHNGEAQPSDTECWRSRQLPTGVRVKKKTAGPESCSQASPESDGHQKEALLEDASVTVCTEAAPAEPSATERSTEESSEVEAGADLALKQPGGEPAIKCIAPTKGPSVAPVQKPLTSFPGFQLPATQGGPRSEDPHTLHSQLSTQLKQKKAALCTVNISALPDKGERLKTQVKELEEAVAALSLTVPTNSTDAGTLEIGKSAAVVSAVSHQPSSSHLFSVPGQATGSCYQSSYPPNPQNQTVCGGRMTERQLLISNATKEAIDHLHHSLESCPDPQAEMPDPKGIKVHLLPHQKCALAWLLWRETQKPCGGILADDMGLGKTLTIIALILAQRKKEEKVLKQQGWISKTDSPLVPSQSTLIVCPASLLHHWKKEIEKHVKKGKLSVYLYHGQNRQKNAQILAGHDVVVTTYSLVSKEVPLSQDEAQVASQDKKREPERSPLQCVVWARVVLDEAHNIKNPKVQTSMAVCRLWSEARWAVTGTPVQNSLLDLYSLLKFLRCAPFDDFKLWKAQVDNGSKRGGERLNILTKALLLRRTKDELDSAGKPLVSLPERECKVHRLKLSHDEQSVYDVIFARSRSTLQSYLKRHEGDKSTNAELSNPFEKVAQEFGISQPGVLSSQQSSQLPASFSPMNILSLLLRLRQCCCHLSLLKKTLDPLELQGDGIALSLEEQLSALSLSETSSGPDAKATVSLSGCSFHSELFEDTSQSTKISAILSEVKKISQFCDNQKSVIVSQWTSMLSIVAIHLGRMKLRFSVIDGSVNPKKRMDLVEEFNTDSKGPQVMLVSLCAGGVGINLVGGNHLFIIDMHWNPALEDQACDRIYRVGQTRDITIHRFVCEGTVEDKISSLQEKKRELAKTVLSGTGSSFNKLSLADLRVIFGV